MLKEKGIRFVHYDPYIDEVEAPLSKKGIYCLATKHSCFQDYIFPDESIVIDPFRYIKRCKNGNIKIHSVGSSNTNL